MGNSIRQEIESLFLILVLSVLLLLPGGRAFPQEGKESFLFLTVKGERIRVEVAQTEEEKARGLMFRENLGQNEGMLFVYGRQEILTFWMKNTPLPLSIAFLDQRGKIVDIQDMEPFSLQTHFSSFPAKYALEMNKGWFRSRGIGPGDTVRIPAFTGK
jgi:uncharacterized membrane protein (UPF0127 family)